MGMEERLRLIDGQFAVKSAPRKGTTILALIPFKPGNEKLRSNQRMKCDVCKK
jgi:hypothetical protein